MYLSVRVILLVNTITVLFLLPNYLEGIIKNNVRVIEGVFVGQQAHLKK